MGQGKGSRDRATRGNLAQKPKFNKIKLNDGREYDLAPLDINLMAEIEDKFDQPFHKILAEGRAKPIRYVIWLRIRDTHPEIDSEEKLGSMIDMNTIYELGELLGVT